MIYNNRSKGIAFSCTAAILITVMSLPLTTLAVNDDFDNPDDNLVSRMSRELTFCRRQCPMHLLCPPTYILYDDADSGCTSGTEL